MPSPVTTNDIKLQSDTTVDVVAQSFNEDVTNVAPEPAESFVKGEKTALVSQLLVKTSLVADGSDGMIGVKVEVVT